VYKMDNKIIILGVITLIIFFSGCIQSNTTKIDALTTNINDHLKNGDQYYNNASTDVNKFQYTNALNSCDSATSEFNQARTSASEGLTYAQNSSDTVYINYMQNVINEIDAKLNATSELKTAITYLQTNDTVNANEHIGNVNTFMNNAVQFNNLRQQIVQQNSAKFK